MSVPVAVSGVVLAFVRALLRGDVDGLAELALPHPELRQLVSPAPPGAAQRLLDELEHPQLHGEELVGDRFVVRLFLGGCLQVLLLRGTKEGWRIEPRYLLAARRADDERQAPARAFYRALLLGDLPTLQHLAFDARGTELLAEHAPPRGEHGQLEHVADALQLIELGIGEPFQVPTGIEFVGQRHRELGIVVLSGLCPSGEIPFLLRQRDGQWRVIAYHFVQQALLQRGASLVR